MNRASLTLLQALLVFAVLVAAWAQVVLIPTVAADEVAAFKPYAPLQTPLVTAGILAVACLQVVLVAVVVLLRRTAKDALFTPASLPWATVLTAAVAAFTALALALLVFVTFADIPSPSDGMELIGLWLGAAATVFAGAVALLGVVIGRRQLAKAVALRSELDLVL